MSGEAQIKLSTSTTTVISTASNISNTNTAGGTTALGNTTDKYPYALATLYINDFSAAPTNNSTVGLYMVRQDVDSTNDDTSTPATTDVESAQFVGAFMIYDTNEAQRHTISIDLGGALAAHFYILNSSGVTINAGSGTECTVKVRPYTLAPAA